MSDRSVLLITAFGPFGGWRVNPTDEITARAAEVLRDRGLQVARRVLPVSLGGALPLLRRTVAEVRPRAVLSCGLHGAADRVQVESRARNRLDFAIPDVCGAQPRGVELEAGGGAHRWTSVDVERVTEALRRAGVPAAHSEDAGSYLCNAVYFTLLGLQLPALFLHLPPLPGLVPQGGTEHGAASPGLAAELQVTAVVSAAGLLWMDARTEAA